MACQWSLTAVFSKENVLTAFTCHQTMHLIILNVWTSVTLNMIVTGLLSLHNLDFVIFYTIAPQVKDVTGDTVGTLQKWENIGKSDFLKIGWQMVVPLERRTVCPIFEWLGLKWCTINVCDVVFGIHHFCLNEGVCLIYLKNIFVFIPYERTNQRSAVLSKFSWRYSSKWDWI